MDVDRIASGIISFAVGAGLIKYGRTILVYVAQIHRKHHQEDTHEDPVQILSMFIALFRILALLASVILLYQGITSD
jgi:hypothetical protein